MQSECKRELEREEKKLELEIKKAAKMGNKQVLITILRSATIVKNQALNVLAKQLVNVRKQKTRTYSAQSKVRQSKCDLCKESLYKCS